MERQLFINEETEDFAYLQSFIFVYHELSIHEVISNRSITAAAPQTALGAAETPHAHAVLDVFALQLRENRENPNHGHAEWGRGVKHFRKGNKSDIVSLENVLYQIHGVTL